MLASLDQYYEAEESFLKYFCHIESFSWGKYFFWDKGHVWPKFNFIRITATPNSNEINEIIEEHKKKKMKVNFKIDLQSEFQLNVPLPNLVFGGVPIAFLKTKNFLISDKMSFDKKFFILKVKTIDDFNIWWEVNSLGRNRSNIFESPVYEIIKQMFIEGSCEFYVVKKSRLEAVACFACSPFGKYGDVNLWGVAVDKKYQRQGIVKSIYHWIQENIKSDVYGQINIDSPTFYLRLREISTVVGLIEAKYEYIF